jgi:hypothetical protein
MFRFQKLGLVFTLFALLMLAAPALAGQIPFSSPDAHVDGPSGTITGTEATLGAYDGIISADIDQVTGAITNGYCNIEFGVGSGDTITFTFEGQIYADGTVNGTFTFVDGTGALAGIMGGGTFAGTTDGITYDTDIEGMYTLP